MRNWCRIHGTSGFAPLDQGSAARATPFRSRPFRPGQSNPDDCALRSRHGGLEHLTLLADSAVSFLDGLDAAEAKLGRRPYSILVEILLARLVADEVRLALDPPETEP